MCKYIYIYLTRIEKQMDWTEKKHKKIDINAAISIITVNINR